MTRSPTAVFLQSIVKKQGHRDLTYQFARVMYFHSGMERLVKYFSRQRHYIVLFGVASTVIILHSARQKTLGVPIKSDVPTSERTPAMSNPALPEKYTSVIVQDFDKDKLMETAIKELETDGWTAPAGLDGVVQKLLEMKPELLHTTAASLVTQTPPGPVLLKADRWKVHYIGCFILNPTTRLLTHAGSKLQTQSVGYCVRICDKQGLAYAAISAGGWCTCGQSISKRSILSIAPTDSLCNVTCKYGADIRSCGGYQFASVYRISMHTQENLTLSDVHQLSDGCFIKPRDFEKVFTKRAVLYNGSAAHCLVYCENAFEVIAAWDPQSNMCMCGKFDARMPIESLQRTPLTEHCDKKYCENTLNCEVRYVMLMRTHAQDNRCESRSFLSQHIGKLTALVSFPGSGNTWLRYLIETAGGIYSGSFFNDEKLYEQGFLGELLPWNSTKTSVIKTHGGRRADKFEKAVVLIRNPYKAVLAEYNRLAAGHVGNAKTEHFKIKEWNYFIIFKLTKWLQVIEECSRLKELHVTYFEDVVTNPIREVRAIMQFLRIPIANLDERLECLKSSINGDFKRPKRKLDFDPFANSMKEYVNLFIKRGREISEKIGFPRLPDYERIQS